jgi:hypothetical protein
MCSKLYVTDLKFVESRIKVGLNKQTKKHHFPQNFWFIYGVFHSISFSRIVLKVKHAGAHTKLPNDASILLISWKEHIKLNRAYTVVKSLLQTWCDNRSNSWSVIYITDTSYTVLSYGLDDQGIWVSFPAWGKRFFSSSFTSRPALGSTQPDIQWILGG